MKTFPSKHNVLLQRAFKIRSNHFNFKKKMDDELDKEYYTSGCLFSHKDQIYNFLLAPHENSYLDRELFNPCYHVIYHTQ